MAQKVFLDTNRFIDVLVGRDDEFLINAPKLELYLSNLSVHIYCYAYKLDIPDDPLMFALKNFELVEFTKDILDKALLGPTKDFEDNIQLHSAVKAGCGKFLTKDKELLKLGIFGDVKIVSA